jgi:hypothetical protein
MDNVQTTIGLSSEGHACLDRLKEDGVFREKVHACRFAISLAIAHESSLDRKRESTFLNLGTLDPDGTLQALVKMLDLSTNTNQSVGRTLETLAEWGLEKMSRDYEDLGMISFNHYAEELKLFHG